MSEHEYYAEYVDKYKGISSWSIFYIFKIKNVGTKSSRSVNHNTYKSISILFDCIFRYYYFYRSYFFVIENIVIEITISCLRPELFICYYLYNCVIYMYNFFILE